MLPLIRNGIPCQGTLRLGIERKVKLVRLSFVTDFWCFQVEGFTVGSGVYGSEPEDTSLG